MYAISVSDLTKTYKNGKEALSKLSLQVEAGEVFSLLGSNGAGKSTLINILNTTLSPTSGNIEILGKPITEKKYIRSNIACVSQHVSLFNHLTMEENLMFQSRLFQISNLQAKKLINGLISDFDLEDYRKDPVSVYSGGIKRRIDIAMGMISNPKVLFLDEPTVALDIVSRKALWDIIMKIKKKYGTTIFLTTHYLEEADELSDTVCIIKNGCQIVQDTPHNLKKYIDTNIVKIELFESMDIARINSLLIDLPFVRDIRVAENRLTVTLHETRSGNNKEELKIVHKTLMDNDVDVKIIELLSPNLDDVFLSIINEKERM